MSGELKGSEMIRLAIWFGLVASLAEICFTMLFTWLGWMHWRALWALTPEVSILAPLLYVPLFCFVGMVFWVVGWLIPWFRRLQGAVFGFSFLLGLDLFIFSGHIRGIFLNPLYIGFFLAIAGITFAHVVSYFAGRREQFFRRFSRASLKWVGSTVAVISLGAPCWLWLREDIATSRLPLPSEKSPNVLLVVVDALRADHLSAYGYPRNKSPNIDKLAQQGTLFETAIAPSSWTLPSHASIVTGLYPRENGAENRRLDGRHTTIAEVFQSQGYRTGAFSANPYFFCRRMGFGRGFMRFSEVSPNASEWIYRLALGRYVLPWIGRMGVKLPSPYRDAANINDSLLRWLDARPAKPFFAMLNYFDVHTPYFPPSPYWQMFSDSSPSDKIKQDWLQNLAPIRTPSGVRTWANAYDGSIRFVDDQIAELLAELRKRALDSDTLIVITSDHGESFGEHGLVEHNNALYLDTIHVPLILFWPGKVPQSLRVTQPVSLVSLPSTLLELAGKANSPGFEGLSLTPLLKPGGVSSWPVPRSELAQLPYSFAYPGDPSLYGSMTSIVDGQWHYIIHENTGEELYDWVNDPTESKDLSRSPEVQEVLAAMRKQIRYR